MQTRDRIITVLGGAGVIALLMLLSRCESENGTDSSGTALPSTAATNQRNFGFNTPGAGRPSSYNGPSLDQLIQDGTRRRVERFSAGGPAETSPDGQVNSQAMFEGERVPPRIEGPNSPNARPPRRFNRPTTPPSVPSSPSQQINPGQGQINQFLQQTALAPTSQPIPQSAAGPSSPSTRPASSSERGSTAPGNAAQPSGSTGTDTSGSTSGSGRNPLIVGGIDLSDFFAGAPFPTVGGGTDNGNGTGTGSGTGNGTGTGTGTGTTAPNRAPTITSLGVSPTVVNAPGPIALTANGASDPDSATGDRVTRVQFFRDSNNNNLFDPATDELLANDNSSADGFGALVTAQTAWLPAGGPVRLFARAQDNSSAFSNIVSTLVTLNRPPTLVSLSASPAFVAPGETITLVASGAADPDPPGAGLASVQFFLDFDNDGGVTDADTLVANVSTAGGTVQASVTAPAGASGTLRYLARPRDQTGTLGTPASATVTVNRAPNTGTLFASPGLVAPPATVTLTASGFTDPDTEAGGPGTATVEFFLDVDRDGIVGSGDISLAVSPAADGSATFVTSVSAGTTVGPTYLARAADTRGLRSGTAATSVIVNRAPEISTLTATPSPRVLAPLTLTAAATDADPPPDAVVAVTFYVDSDSDGSLNTQTDERLALDTTPANGFTATLTARAEWTPSRRFFAVARDSRAIDSNPRPLDVNIGPFPDVSLRVRAGAAPGGDGLSWPAAFDTFESAFETAGRTGGVVNQLWVAAGTYSQPVTVTSPISILGGFAGTSETQAAQRDWAANPTILNPAGAGRAVDIGAVPNATIDGFTITGGLAGSGAGVRSAAIETTIANCIIRNNTSTGVGGAGVHLLNPGTGTRLVNCLFVANNAQGTGRGAAVLIDQSASGVLIANCTATGNTSAAPDSGTVTVTAGAPSIINTIVSFNPGAGIVASPGASPLVSNCNLFANTGADALGAFVPTAPIAGDPLFTNAGASDFTLDVGSPCLDRGTTSQPPPEFTFDLAHRPRRVDADANGSTVPDAGAFERPCSPPVCVGDLTGNGTIDTLDLVIFLGAFGRPLPPPPAVTADLNNDGAVNTADLVIFLARFGSPCPTCP